MKPLFVLIISFLTAAAACYFIQPAFNYIVSGKIALSIMLLFTSLGHFKFTRGMAMMLPPFVPAKHFIILLTGFIEIIAAIGILIHSTAYTTGILLIIFFIVLLPANIYAAFKKVNYETATYNGKGLSYLWFRVPFQLLLIIWVWWFVVKDGYY